MIQPQLKLDFSRMNLLIAILEAETPLAHLAVRWLARYVCQFFGALKSFAEVYSTTTLSCDFVPSMLICKM